MRKKIKKRRADANVMTKSEMCRLSESVFRLDLDDVKTKFSPYENLANAIICAAVDDYRMALKERRQDLIKDLEKFFYSNYFYSLSSVSPKKILNRLFDEYKIENSKVPKMLEKHFAKMNEIRKL